MTHDQLCPCNESGHTHYEYAPSRVCTYCRCDLIAQVLKESQRRYAESLIADIETLVWLARKGMR
jgi:hypothetical protein